MLDFLKEKYLTEEFFEKYKWRIICSVIAFIIAVLFINIGFFKTLLLLVLVTAGYAFGNWRDGGVNPVDFIRSFIKQNIG